MTEPLAPAAVEPGSAADAHEQVPREASQSEEVPREASRSEESPREESPRGVSPPSGALTEASRRDGTLADGGGLLIAALLAAGVALGVGVTLVVVMRRAPSPPARASVAKLAAEELAVSVASVAEACGVEPGEGANARETLRLAFERCAPDPFRPGSAPPDALLLPPRPARSAKAVELPRRSAPERPDPCLERCAGGHDACGKACGPEPIGDAFVAWQACATRCLTESSRCRLGCP